MNFDEVVFLDSFPKLDLHGYDRESARVEIEDFLKEQQKLKMEYVVIVHGIGTGVLRQMTQEVLRKNKYVIDFKTYYYNQGCTIVKLKIDKT